jgi:hypothetical protein
VKEKEFKENTTLFESGGWVGRWVGGAREMRKHETRRISSNTSEQIQEDHQPGELESMENSVT